jgi:hypothetical protein
MHTIGMIWPAIDDGREKQSKKRGELSGVRITCGHPGTFRNTMNPSHMDVGADSAYQPERTGIAAPRDTETQPYKYCEPTERTGCLNFSHN